MAVTLGRTGIWSGSRNWPEDPAAATAAAAELAGLGYRTLWLGMASPGLELAATALRATSGLTVATGIVSVWAAPAADVAAAYHRVTAACPGRFLLGLGASHAHVVARTGQQYVRPYQKTARFLDELDIASPPVPPEGRALAALGPRMLALAGQRTAGAHPYLVPPEHTRRARQIMGDGPLLAPEQMAILETDPARAREVARAALHMYLQAPNYVASLRRLGFTPDDIGQATDRLVDALVVWGNAETVAARVAEHHQAGADHVCVQVLTGEPGLPLAQWRALAPALTALT
ncbi:MAG: TIGR03620 family F420-dependent LLM class oxidoreductase [Actinobacteria bacterium]|nr:TIGR03620 family F420-dependent LLM class oxidoreductase [Actinomycetota bacterium]